MKKVEHLLPPERNREVTEALDDLEIMKMGVLFYRFAALGIKTWKPVFMLLSGRGVVHIFQREGDDKPMLTIGLQFCTVNLAPSVHPNAFRIMEQKPSLTGRERIVKHCFRSGKQATMAEWMVALKPFLPSKSVEITQREMTKFQQKRVYEAIKSGRFKKQ